MPIGPWAANDATIYPAVRAWLTDPVAAARAYGNISTWDTRNVSSMAQFFCAEERACTAHYHPNASAFNSDLSGWNTSAVTSMYYMFNDCEAFNASA